MNSVVLKSEIDNDPLGKGYAEFMPANPSKVVEMLNAYTETMIKTVKAGDAMAWAASGPYASIIDASNDITNPCRASCLVLRETFAAGFDIEFGNENLQSMFAAWEQTGIITTEQRDAFIAIATQPASRAEVLGLPEVTYKDVCDLYWNADGSVK